MKLFKAGILVFLSFYVFGNQNNWVNELDSLNARIEKEYNKRFGIELTGTGGGGVQGFELYSPKFSRNRPTTRSESAILLLEVAEDLLKKINVNPTLVQNMINFPFEPKNLSLSIFFSESSFESVKKGQIFCISLFPDKIRYGIRTTLGKRSNWEDIQLKTTLENIDNTHKRFPYLWECVEKSGAGQ